MNIDLPPLLFSVSTEDGEYQLFRQPSNPPTSELLSINPIHPITKEDLEKIKKRHLWMKLAGYIEKYLLNNRESHYDLTKYTLYQIDEVDADVSIYMDYHTEPPNYYYKMFSKNVEYESDDSLEKDVLIYDSKCFTTVFSLLEHIQMVEDTYTFLDYHLLSPEKMEEAKLQRFFLPIHSDKICSVCYEPTVEYTICKHSICFKCRNKCIVQGKTTCPMCRMTNLKYYPNTL